MAYQVQMKMALATRISSERRDRRDDNHESSRKRHRSESRSESPQIKLSLRDRERGHDSDKDRERHRKEIGVIIWKVKDGTAITEKRVEAKSGMFMTETEAETGDRRRRGIRLNIVVVHRRR
ncbi:hypothetical protein NC651_017336 [Populus alba x Populus x berolinensis]|nr:hypothetical protein NC651_017336 [Populus alba x Populus x berolinensis]